MTAEGVVGKLVGGRYRVVRRLGAGGMGTVYVAVQEPLGRDVALKVVRRDLSGDEKTIERFRREANTLSKAHHPHIVTIYDFGELEDGSLYIAMELVPGQNLRQRLQSQGPMPVKKTLTLMRDVSSALAAAHALNIIHRDLKPENILLMEATGNPDFAKVLDFGVAKLVGDDSLQDQEALTQRGSVVGTPGYIAPEIALRGVTSDARSDLYALGVVWFECLSGKPPFRAQTATALLMAHALDPVPSLPDAIPLPVAGLVQRLLAKSPEDRPSSASELSALIDSLPPFDSGAGIRLGAAPLVDAVNADAATINDIPLPRPVVRPSSRPGTASSPSSPASTFDPPHTQPEHTETSVASLEQIAAIEASTPTARPKTPSTSPTMSPASSAASASASSPSASSPSASASSPSASASPSASSPSASSSLSASSPSLSSPASPHASQRSLVVPAALIAGAIVLAAAIGAYAVKSGQGSNVVDAGVVGVVHAQDAGVGDHDAGVAAWAVLDAGAKTDAGPKVKPKADAGTKPHHVVKHKSDAGFVPDIYSP